MRCRVQMMSVSSTLTLARKSDGLDQISNSGQYGMAKMHLGKLKMVLSYTGEPVPAVRREERLANGERFPDHWFEASDERIIDGNLLDPIKHPTLLLKQENDEVVTYCPTNKLPFKPEVVFYDDGSENNTITQTFYDNDGYVWYNDDDTWSVRVNDQDEMQIMNYEGTLSLDVLGAGTSTREPQIVLAFFLIHGRTRMYIEGTFMSNETQQSYMSFSKIMKKTLLIFK